MAPTKLQKQPHWSAAHVVGAVAVLSAQCCEAMKTEGSVTLKANSTTFMTKFCYTYEPEGNHRAGVVEVRVHLPLESRRHNAQMLLFDDEDHSYPGPSDAWHAMSCKQREEHARQWESIDWTLASGPEGHLLRFTIKQKLRPRWWYIAFSECSDAGEDLQMTYQMHLTNTGYGWASELSTDRRFMPHLFAVLVVVYGCLSFAQLHSNRDVAARAKDDSANGKAAHPFARILTAGVLLALCDSALSALHLAVFTSNGVGLPWIQVLSQLLSVTASFVLASLLLLVSQGKCISYIMVANDAWSMLRLLGPFLVSCFALEMWGEYSVSRNYTTNYVYTTPVGWALICVDLLLLNIYAVGLWRTYKAEHSPEVATFYSRWGVVYGLWFMVLPVTALLAQLVLAPYVSLIISTGAKKGVTAMLYGVLVVGVWPGNTRTYFRLNAAETKPQLPGLLGRRHNGLPQACQSAAGKYSFPCSSP